MYKNPHIQLIYNAINRFRKGVSGFDDIQFTLSLVRGLIEGDMLNADFLRQYLYETENKIELTWFTLGEAEAIIQINNILNDLENILNNINSSH